jgi:L-threonylcarbamoyladenylate synthase
MKTKLISAQHPGAITHAFDVLQHGGLVAFPTDTVYGLAAPVFNEESIDRLYIVKGRNSNKAIALLLGQIDDLEKVAVDINEYTRLFAERFWPGPLTLIVPRHPDLPAILAPAPTIGVRIPDHPVALDLLRTTGPLAVTSANLSGADNACTAQQVLDQLNGRVHLIIDGGQTPGGVPSTVVECTTPKFQILRKGPISQMELEAALV